MSASEYNQTLDQNVLEMTYFDKFSFSKTNV